QNDRTCHFVIQELPKNKFKGISLMDTAGFDVFFLTMGAAMVFAMHAGFAFLEAGTVRKKNQVNSLVRVITDFGFSTISYFFIGLPWRTVFTFSLRSRS
ncbi:MAG: hypothetical protein Q9M17_05315, partial [Mariprofundus sp.]|nr:hypothetical protein [Mariprofundus sp.]